MYLKQIQTYGFKSFADKIDFEFTNNLNGIVGPNGSGKSNVVDAVRWVLGEQSNKSLRATDNTSVIFSGSKSRKPLNSAMVNIVFDNTDRHLPIDFNEVSIKRVLYRTGESEYYLNGEKCRLKDITELITDSGAAKESFNIIGQGKIDEILTTKAIDRRVIFEEAAGVLKYKKRKQEAIRKLERTNLNLSRVTDILYELEQNLGPLKEQSEVAKKYLECKDKLTNYDISLMIYDVDNFSQELNICKEEIVNLTDKILELNKNNTNYDIEIVKIKDKISLIENKLTKSNQDTLDLTQKLEQTSADLRILKERKKYQDKNIDMENITKINESILNTKSDISIVNKDIDVYLKKLNNCLDEIKILEDKINTLRNNIDKNNQIISTNKMEITNLKYQITYLEERINNNGYAPKSVSVFLNNPLFTGVYGTISSLIKTKDEYANCVSVAINASSNYLVVSDNLLAKRMVEYLKKNHLGRATIYPLNVIKPRYIDSDTLRKIEKIDGYISTIDKILDYDNKYENVILNLFGNVLLVSNLDTANLISKEINERYKIITLDGQVVNVGGSITGGDTLKTTDLIKQRYELSDNMNKLTNLNNKDESLNKENISLNQELNSLIEKLHVKNIEKIDYQDNLDNKKLIASKYQDKLKELEKELEDITLIKDGNSLDEENKLLNKYYQIKEEIDNLTKEVSLNKIERDKLNNDLNELESISKNSTQHISKLEKNLKDYELKSSKLEIKIDNILNSLNEDYSITYKEAKDKYILTSDPEIVRKEVSNLKNTLKESSMVNLLAIDEYEKVSTRYQFLSKQKEDLNNAESSLLQIINEMDEVMKKKFVTTFEEVRKEFKVVFRELFKGGSADIYMTDPDNVLETGIELEATPPGKNLKSIQSLSGGEKTFTAISLLFAILNVRPVPFCLFDEVEAALDDANVDAFGEYLNKYRDKTQFIIITHKKKTMEFIDTLYGVTMQESGVSKKVSVKLNKINN